MLTVEINPKDALVEIHCDTVGLETLRYLLDVLKQHGGHVHLKTPAWGGHELTEVAQGDDTVLVHHLAIGMHAPTRDAAP